MTEETPPLLTDQAPPKRRRFSVRRLLFWQFVLAPVFLLPVTFRQTYSSGGHLLSQLASQLIFPVIYVAVLVWMRYRGMPRGSFTRKSVVTAGIRSGVGYALLVAILSWGWVLFHPLRRLVDLYLAGLLLMSFRDLFLPTLFLPVELGIYYSVIGAATGGVVGVILGRRAQGRATSAS